MPNVHVRDISIEVGVSDSTSPPMVESVTVATDCFALGDSKSGESSSAKTTSPEPDTFKSSVATDIHMPSRRSQLITVLDVEQSLASRSNKYQEDATRFEALDLLIKQYRLSHWDRNTATLVEFQPRLLLKSLSNAFSRVGPEAHRVALPDFFQDPSQQAQKAVKVRQRDVEQYELTLNLPSYGTFPFVHTSEDVKLELARLDNGESDVQVSLENCVLTPIDENLETRELSSDAKAAINLFSQLVVIKDIDESRVDRCHNDYKYQDTASQLKALRLIIRRFDLRRWDKRNGTIVAMTEQPLRKMVNSLFLRRSFCREHISSAVIWSEGSRALGAETIDWLLNRTGQSREGRGLGSLGDVTKATLNAEVTAALSESGGGRDEASASRRDQTDSQDTDDPPTRLSRKRKAKQADLPSQSALSASKYARNAESVLSASTPPVVVQKAELPASIAQPALGLDLSTPAHLPGAPSPQEQRYTTTGSSSGLSSDVGIYFDGRMYDNVAESTALDTRLQSETSEFDLRRLASTIAGIVTSIQHAVSSLFSDLNLDVSLPSPFLMASSQRLMVLVRRCWGDDWVSACKTLIAARMFSAFDVTKALVAAFLFEDIFKSDTSWLTGIFKDLGLPLPCYKGEFTTVHLTHIMADTTAETSEIFLELASMDRDRMHEAQRKARVFVATGVLESEPPVLHDHANKLVESLLLLLHSHINSLSSLAQLYHPHGSSSNSIPWEENLQKRLTTIAEEAVNVKLHLTHSRSSHHFFWPSPELPFDPARMESAYPMQCEREEQVVGFTIFPGLSVEIGNHFQDVRPAQVVTRVLGVRSDSASSFLSDSASSLRLSMG